MNPAQRRQAYACDVTYGTNSEFGFDYLRDNMAPLARGVRPARARVRDRRRGRQHPDRRGADAADHLRRARAGGRHLLHLRPPGQADGRRGDEAEAEVAGRVARHLRGRATTTSTTRSTRPSPRPRRGVAKAEKFLGVDNLYVSEHGTLVNHLIQSLKAESLFKRDNDYAVIDGEVKIIDEFTGRILEGRRWSEGLHQAIEAKEGVRDPRGEPDPGDDHAPELLPPLRQAHRDDRHGAHRGARVHEDLRDPGGRDPDQPADGPRRPQRPDLQDQERQVEGGRQRDRRAPRARPADPRRDDLGRGLGDALRAS